MHDEQLIAAVLERDEFRVSPPVLLDIGAAGTLNPRWKLFARYSLCVAFDADDREMGYIEHKTSDYRRLIVYNRIVSAELEGVAPFYLTRSPQCSSLLPPHTESLQSWAFAPLFTPERVVDLPVVTLPAVLRELGIARVDWFKVDSQGTDLRLFRSLGDTGMKKALAVGFEPGILNAYRGEDKLWQIMSCMDDLPFWMADLTVKGSQRIRSDLLQKQLTSLERRMLPWLLPTSPGWGEAQYLNTMGDEVSDLGVREYLLMWVFAMSLGQYGFAFESALRGSERFGDPQFTVLSEHARKCIKNQLWHVPLRLAERAFRSIGERIGLGW